MLKLLERLSTPKTVTSQQLKKIRGTVQLGACFGTNKQSKFINDLALKAIDHAQFVGKNPVKEIFAELDYLQMVSDDLRKEIKSILQER